MPSGLILGIESSCDETAAAVVRGGEQVLSSVVASQFSAHQPYGGVVPELAAREHLRAVVPVVRQALADAKVTLAEIDAIAVTQGPGLAGALLVGITYAKALGFAARKPLIAVNHLEGHIHSVLLEEAGERGQDALATAGGTPALLQFTAGGTPALLQFTAGGTLRPRSGQTPALQFPVLALVVSGGHTHLYLCETADPHPAPKEGEGWGTRAEGRGARTWRYRNIGHTRDDAAGEAFDKVAKLLGLGYPGGPIIEQLAQHGDPAAVHFPIAQLKHPERGAKAADGPTFDFSYSGIKTAVLRYTETHTMKPGIEARRAALANVAKPTVEQVLALCDKATLDLVAGFQHGMVQDIVAKTIAAAEATAARTLIVTGGVAANRNLREEFESRAPRSGVELRFPSRRMSTDNAAMIAAAAYPKFLAGEFAEEGFSAEAGMALR
ncbi:MAG: tRNA (adenosine(37)-N6)-threonylcarbamoyltransferase complex transferase subunit TsaD [Acidobacteriales bacterium]|nr:tRNA (adenosine(37)-N6)-threonylcarbamoyltransferase complex transferase subunit TsaD [Terriglobales bacterium]